VMKQLQIDMRNQLMQVKTQVATAISESRKLHSRAKEKKAEAEIWHKKAEQAIQQNNDAAARNALNRYNEIIRQAQRYQQQQSEQEQLVSTMKGVLQQLEAKISEVETTIELLATRKRNALLQQRVFGALKKSDEMKDSRRAEQAFDGVMDSEARAQAMVDLHQRDLDVQLDQLSKEQLLEKQLKALKAKNLSVMETPLLQEGNSLRSPLIPPEPQNNIPARKRPDAQSEKIEPSDTQTGTNELDITQLKKLMEK
jgi:phage shock protein A